MTGEDGYSAMNFTIQLGDTGGANLYQRDFNKIKFVAQRNGVQLT